MTVLEGFQLTSGLGGRRLHLPGGTGPDLLATYQAVPALAGVTFAYDLGTPAVAGVAPAKGWTTGGTTLKVTGSGFTEADAVEVGTARRPPMSR